MSHCACGSSYIGLGDLFLSTYVAFINQERKGADLRLANSSWNAKNNTLRIKKNELYICARTYVRTYTQFQIGRHLKLFLHPGSQYLAVLY